MKNVYRENILVEQVALTALSCYLCGVIFGMTDEMTKQRLQDGRTFCCPNGHDQHYTDSYKAQLERTQADLIDAKGRITSLQNENQRIQKNAQLKTRQLKQLKRRSTAGVCPYCHRTISQMQRHIASKHPDELTAIEHSES